MNGHKPVRTIAWHARPDQSGTVLLLALIVMSSVVMSSMGLGSLIIGSLQQSRLMDGAIIAYYAAESGAEEALFLARRQDETPPSVPDARTLANGAGWTRTVSGTETVLRLGKIERDGLAEILLYDPDLQTAGAAERLEVTWNDSCGGCSVLSASVVGWTPGSAWDPLNPLNVAFGQTRHSGGTASLAVADPSRLNRLRMRAEGAALEDVRVRGFDGAGEPAPLPGRLSLDLRGRYARVEQKLLVSLPRRAPLSGIFDYVVFSECSIVKGGTISCP